MTKPACYACIHLYDSADNAKRCRVAKGGQVVTPIREKMCGQFVRKVGAVDQVPPWYVEAWHVDAEGRN